MNEGCYHCGTTEREMRPYGPGGAMVCHPCATETPERNEQTEAAFGALVDAAETVGGGVSTIGTEEGPTPGLPPGLSRG